MKKTSLLLYLLICLSSSMICAVLPKELHKTGVEITYTVIQQLKQPYDNQNNKWLKTLTKLGACGAIASLLMLCLSHNQDQSADNYKAGLVIFGGMSLGAIILTQEQKIAHYELHRNLAVKQLESTIIIFDKITPTTFS